jgi:acyl-CoA thioesterase-1
MLLGFHAFSYAGHDDINILILGDSLSAAHNLSVDQGWPRLFSDNMRAKFPQSNVINASISGETTFGGLQRLPRLLTELKPTHLIIELGGNDGLRGLNLNQSSDNLRQMAILAKQQNVTILLIGVRLPPNLGAAYNKRFQSMFENVARDQETAYLPRFLEGVAASEPDLMQSDGIHPTAKAQPALAAKVELTMTELLKTGSH